MSAPHASAGERALARVLAGAHRLSADRIPALVADAATGLGGRDAAILVADYEQEVLVPLAGDGEPADIDGTVAGRAFRQGIPQRIEVEDGERLWVPLLDGLERLGVLALTFDVVDDEIDAAVRRLASLTAEIVLSKAQFSDAVERAARRRPMTLAAEIQWALMPPLTAGTEDVVVAAILEPAYGVGGDLVDYALDAGQAHVAIYDAMGHGIDAGLSSSLAVAACRNARRAGGGLEEQAAAAERAIHQQYRGERFVTGVIGELDAETGLFRWVNAGHPPPLLLRGGRIVKELDHPDGATPLGLAMNDELVVHEERLEPADRLLLYTDGVIEARDEATGEEFGVDRLVDHITRADASGELLPETMRRLSRTLREFRGAELRDDASQLLVEWRGEAGDRQPARLVPGDLP